MRSDALLRRRGPHVSHLDGPVDARAGEAVGSQELALVAELAGEALHEGNVGLDVLLRPRRDLVGAAAGGVHHEHEFHGVLSFGWMRRAGAGSPRSYPRDGAGRAF